MRPASSGCSQNAIPGPPRPRICVRGAPCSFRIQGRLPLESTIRESLLFRSRGASCWGFGGREGVSLPCYARDEEGAASLPHRSEAGELTLARRRCSSGSPLYAAATCRSLPDDCQGRRSLRGGGCCPELARTHPTPSTGLWGVGCSGARSRCSCPSPPNPASATPRGRCSSSHATPHAAPLKGGTTCWRRPPGSRLMHGCDAMLCNAVLLCHAMRSRAVLCYAMV